MDWSRSAAYSKALLAGAAVGAAVTTLAVAASFGFSLEPARMYLAVFPVAFGVFFVGILLTGFPAWALATRFGRHRWYDAALLGGALPFLVVFAWVVSFEPVSSAVLAAASIGVAGALAGLTGWRIISAE